MTTGRPCSAIIARPVKEQGGRRDGLYMKLVARAAFETVNPHPMNMGPREIAHLLRLMADRMDGLED